MAGMKGLLTRYSIFLWCGMGFLFVSIRHILVNGYNHRAGFMMMLGLALLAAAFTDRKKRQLQSWQKEQAQNPKNGRAKKGQ
jgi:hypothetical protein